MSKATGGGGGGGVSGESAFEHIIEARRGEIVSDHAYRSLEELDRERERKRQELYLEDKRREVSARGQTAQSLVNADLIEILDEKDLLPQREPAAASSRAASGMRSLLPSWPASSEADQRLQHAAKEMGEALSLKAGELKDTALHVTSSLSKKYLPARFSSKTGDSGQADWERYGRKMDKVNSLIVKAERKVNEAKTAQPHNAAELYLQANAYRQKALHLATRAQGLAANMKKSIDAKVSEIERGATPHRDLWELYGATRLRAQELFDRSEALRREANSSSDKMKSAELHNDAIHLRKKACRKAKKAQKLAAEVQKQSEQRVEELTQRTLAGNSSGSASGAGMAAY
jgi:hypothetical protein